MRVLQQVRLWDKSASCAVAGRETGKRNEILVAEAIVVPVCHGTRNKAQLHIKQFAPIYPPSYLPGHQFTCLPTLRAGEYRATPDRRDIKCYSPTASAEIAISRSDTGLHANGVATGVIDRATSGILSASVILSFRLVSLS